MLRSLHIENMAIIAALDVDFDGGFTAITGETGAGKSVMIDALTFLLGARPTRDLLRRGASLGTVSALFTDIGTAALEYLAGAEILENPSPDTEILLQRTLDAAGKTVARLNGRMISQTILRELAGYLVSVQGQNDAPLLMQQATQQAMLDSVAPMGDALARYRECYQKHTELRAQLDGMVKDTAEKARLADILRFQIAEIDEAALRDGEEEKLILKRQKLQYAEKIAKQSGFAYHVLLGSEKASAALILERAAAAMKGISGVVPEADALAEKLSAMRYEVEDIALTARDFADEVDGDPTEALNAVEARLDNISRLERKYGKDIAEILAFRADAAGKLRLLDLGEEAGECIKEEIAALERRMRELAARCHEARVLAAQGLNGKIMQELSFLDMPAVRFEIAVNDTNRLLPDGTDEVVFMISPNKGEEMKPLSRVASGGELSRVILALRAVLNDREGVTTAIFDEVDTGISGKTARKIGIKLLEIGRTMQVLSVTHSAQVASLATAHYKIAKHESEGRTVATVTPLDREGRVAEVARILGGIHVTDTQRRAAVEMIEEGEGYR